MKKTKPNVLLKILLTLMMGALTLTVMAWERDQLLERMVPETCEIEEFESLEHYEKERGRHETWTVPFLIRGVAQSWDARHHWQKEYLIEKYGSRIVKHGSEYSIVYGGGAAELTTTMKEVIEDLENENASFVFQPSILDDIPELRNDFVVPSIFESWDSINREHNGDLWHMLSLGPSKKGLPFHNHGKTWLAIVHGAKLWFLYPLGYGFGKQSTETPLQWYQSIYSEISDKPLPPLYTPSKNTCLPHESDSCHHNSHYSRPFTCLQNAGDILFVPAQWQHMTLNVGETIAVGGQELLQDEERLSNAKAAYEANLRNTIVLKDYGLALMNMAGGIQDHLSTLVNETMIITNSTNATQNMILHIRNFSNDSFLIITRKGESLRNSSFVSSDGFNLTCDESLSFSLDETNLSFEELKSNFTERLNLNIIEEAPSQENEAYKCLVQLCFICGEKSLLDANPSTFSVSPVAHVTNVNDIVLFVQASMEKHSALSGSIRSQSVRVKQMYDEAEHFLLRVLEIQKDQPEVISMISEMYLRQGKFTELQELLITADQIFTSWNIERSHDEPTLASLFQKLGSLAFKAKQYHYAASLLLKSISIFREFFPAWYDLVLAYVALHDVDRRDQAMNEMTQIFTSTWHQMHIEHLRKEFNP